MRLDPAPTPRWPKYLALDRACGGKCEVLEAGGVDTSQVQTMISMATPYTRQRLGQQLTGLATVMAMPGWSKISCKDSILEQPGIQVY